MKYLSDKLITKKYVDDFIERASIEVDIINDSTPKNINPNFHTATKIISHYKTYMFERSEFGVPWVKLLSTYSRSVAYPTCIAVQVYKGAKYEVINWIDTDRDIVVKLRDHNNKFIAEKQVFASDKPQRVVLNFTHTDTTRAYSFRLFFEGDIKNTRFTKFAIERVV